MIRSHIAMARDPGARRFRVHDRRPVRLAVSVASHAAGWRCDGRIHNVGLGGACIELPQQVAVGERVSVSFMAPTLWDPLEIPANVAWAHPASGTTPTRCGVAFDHESEAAVLALFELIGTLAF